MPLSRSLSLPSSLSLFHPLSPSPSVSVCAVVLKFHLVEAFITFYSMVYPQHATPTPHHASAAQWNVLAYETTPARGAAHFICGWGGGLVRGAG